jgi:predicted TIM-barrel fold metal-dependent hydrolase
MTDTVTATTEVPHVPKRRTTRSVIDCDVHNELLSIDQLRRYLDEPWAGYLDVSTFRSPRNFHYVVWFGNDRSDTTMPDGSRGSAHYDQLLAQHVDTYDISYAILTGPASLASLCYFGQREFATALAAAYNDWQTDTWLGRDDRLRGSIVVNAADAEGAAAEIDRSAGRPGVVQVMLPMRSPAYVPWSDEKYHPIWEAAVRNDVAVAFHLAPYTGNVAPPTSAGWPRSYMEISATYPIAAQSELSGLICRGVFERFPELRIVLVENGFTWLPAFLWRHDQRWRELREEVPWLNRTPTETVHAQVRLTTQPLDEPTIAGHLAQAIDMIGSDEVLMFSSDYPHWDFDSPTRVLNREIDKGLRRKIMYDNAAAFYRLG